jgi:hypothetical protein
LTPTSANEALLQNPRLNTTVTFGLATLSNGIVVDSASPQELSYVTSTGGGDNPGGDVIQSSPSFGATCSMMMAVVACMMLSALF